MNFNPISAIKAVGSGIKHLAGEVAHPVGHYLVESGKLASLVPGVGPLVGGAMTTAGGLMEGDGVKDSLINGGKSAVQNYALGKLGSALGGSGSIGDKAGAVYGAVKNGVPGITPAGGQPGGGGGTGFDLGSLGQGLVTGLAGVDAVRQQQHARDTQNKAVQYATDSYDSRAPLRTAGMAGMLNPQAPPGLAAIRRNQGNPYASPVPALAPVRSA